MTPAYPSRDAIRSLRREQVARKVIARWRALAPRDHRPTLIACSGGADSVALLLALASAEPDDLVVAHVVHDMRAVEVAERDRDHAGALASALEIPFHAASIRITGPNVESDARTRRYAALVEIARASGCRTIATGHHADDQLETFLMRAIRGSAPRGMRGIAERRRLEHGIRLIRPMLHVTHECCTGLCSSAGVPWCEDRTNHDTTRTRAALRAHVLPALRAIRPDVAQRVSRGAIMQRDAHAAVRGRASELLAHGPPWDREMLARERAIVIGEVLRVGARQIGVTRRDALTQGVLVPVIRAIKDSSTEPRTFEFPQHVRVYVEARRVSMTGKPPSD